MGQLDLENMILHYCFTIKVSNEKGFALVSCLSIESNMA